MTDLWSWQCLLCGLASGRSNLCAGCRADLPWVRDPCRRCGAPLDATCRPRGCSRCNTATAAIDRCRSALIYEYPVDRLVTRMKFGSRSDCALALGELLFAYLRAARLRAALQLPDAVAPVPLHRRRLVRRGFNQASAIAAPVMRAWRLPALRGCRRIVNTAEQTTLSGVRRRTNLRGAFAVDGDISGARIAIVDDVLTTGATANELAATLRDAGAAKVELWVAARSAPQVSGRNV